MNRVGVFGGSFDPPHIGHLGVAQQALRQLHLDSLLWIPARHSPFKAESEATKAKHRVAMTRLMVNENPAFKLDLREMNRPGPSYTIDTIQSLVTELGDPLIFLLVGADSYEQFPRWKRASDIQNIAQLVVYQRESAINGSLNPPLRPTDMLLEGAPISCSSTHIRNECAKKNPIDQWVTPEVATYIHANELYLTA